MPRAALLVLDSVGVGAAEDAAAFGDAGADTLGHLALACADGRGNRPGLRAGPLRVPHLARLGLAHAYRASTGRELAGVPAPEAPAGAFGFAVERSAGKDTPSGHWELTGCPVPFAWTTFPDRVPAFPGEFTAALVAEAGLPGVLGDRHSNGVAIIEALGEASVRTGAPILYTSADSVVQIAAHEDAFGLERLYELCRVARRLSDPLGVCRVIARPFTGPPGAFRRTANRRDYAVPPPGPTLLDVAAGAGRAVISVGKIGDIFAHRATGEEVKTGPNALTQSATLAALDRLPDGGLLVANYVDFDQEFGHRRDVAGYAECLERFDAGVPELLARLRPGDLLALTADHGNDSTAPGTDHTREHAPVLLVGPDVAPRPLGRLDFADVGATLATWLGLPPPGGAPARPL